MKEIPFVAGISDSLALLVRLGCSCAVLLLLGEVAVSGVMWLVLVCGGA